MSNSILQDKVRRIENALREFGIQSMVALYGEPELSDFALSETTEQSIDGTTTSTLVATWTPPSIPGFKGAKLKVRLEVGDDVAEVAGELGTYRWSPVVPGHYTVYASTLHGDKVYGQTSAEIEIKGDTTAPGKPLGLKATGQFRSVLLEWVNPNDPDFDHVRIWESDDGTYDNAVRIADVKSDSHARDGLGVLDTRWYWVQSVDRTGNASELTGPVSATTTALEATDIPEQIIAESHLIGTLQERIDKIEAMETDFEEFDLSHIANYEALGEGLLRAVLDASGQRDLVRDAGIHVDPDSGEVEIYAFEQFKDETNDELTYLRSQITVQAEQIDLRVTSTELSAAIAAAQLDPNGQNLFDGLQEQITTNSGSISVNADAIETNVQEISAVKEDAATLAGRVSANEADIKLVPGQITEAVSALKTEIDPEGNISERLTTAEEDISALDGRITQEVTSVSNALGSTEDLAEVTLQDLLTGSEEMDRRRESIALAKEEMTAYTDGEVRAEAQKRTVLAATVADHSAAIEENMRVIAGEVKVSDQGTAPSNPSFGDIWIDDDGLAHRWNGSKWIEMPEATKADLEKWKTTSKAQYTLKVQAGTGDQKAIAGIGLFAGEDEPSDFTVLADRFKVYHPSSDGDPVQVFSLADGQLVLNADLFVRGIDGMGTGWITGDKIAATSLIQLATGGKLQIGSGGAVDVGSGAILLDTSGGVPRIRVNDPDDLLTGDFLEMTNGRLHLYKYIAGAHRLHAAVTRREQGVGTSGQWVYLAGYWSSEPSIMLSPRRIQSYDAGYPSADQMWSVYVESAEEYATGQWRFKPRAKLELSATSTAISADYEYSGDGRNLGDEGFGSYANDDDFWSNSSDFVEFISDTITSPGGISSVDVSLNGRAMDYETKTWGGGFSISYNKQSSVTVELQYRAYGSATWITAETQTKVFDFVSYNALPPLQAFTFHKDFGSSGQWQIRLVSWASEIDSAGTKSYSWDSEPSDLIDQQFDIALTSGSFNAESSVIYPDGTVNYIAIGE